jgi:hypothetical protein
VIQPPAVNPLEVIAEMNEIWARGDRDEIAEKFAGLGSSILPSDFSELLYVVYGSRRGGTPFGPWPYKIGVMTERRNGNSREVHVFNEEGYFVNENVSGSGRYFQGSDDASLVYLPVEVKNGKVKTLDVIASDRYALLKRMAGGDTRLLDRTSTFSTGLLNFDVAFLDDRSLHLRLVAGSTPFSKMGGVMGEVQYGEDLFHGRIGGGFVFEDTYFDDADNLIGYLDTENTIRTPYLKYVNPGSTKGIRAWGSLTVAASGMAHRAMSSRALNRRKKVSPRWGIQAEARAIPELHAELATDQFLIGLSGGITTAIVPGGSSNLDNPERTLGLYPIRKHVELKIRLNLSKTLHDTQEINFNTPIFLGTKLTGEFSEISDKTRASLTLEWGAVTVEALVETEAFKHGSFTDIRLGGGVTWKGIRVTALKSIEDGDFRVEFGVDLMILADP